MIEKTAHCLYAMTANPLKGMLAAAAMLSTYTVSELQLFDLRLRIILSVCGLIVGIPATISTLWRGFVAVRNFFKK